jgi:proline iminopeptidase
MFLSKHEAPFTQKITIPARASGPQTQLFTKILAHNKDKLGKQRPVAFILPGGPGIDHTAYLSYRCLVDVVDLVFHDPRGCGQSDKNHAATYTMENYIEDIEALRRALHLEKIIVIGKSYGSVCAMGYALRYQQHIQKLILSAGAPSFRAMDTARENLAKLATPKQIAAYEKLWSGTFTSTRDLSTFFIKTAPLYSKHTKTKIEAFALAYFAKNFCYEATNLGFSDFLRRFDFEPDLHRIFCETLILSGEQDWVNDVKYARLMAEKIPNNLLKVFANAGHAMEVDVGKAYFDVIRAFISTTLLAPVPSPELATV